MARFVLLVTVLAALTGCSAKLGGLPLPGPAAAESPVTAEVLGDLSTIEPCTLTDPEVFRRFGSAEFGTPESLDYCTVSVRPDLSSEVIIRVGRLGRLSDAPDLQGQRLEDVDDNLYTVQGYDDSSICSQALVFAGDDLTIEVAGIHSAGEVTTNCDMVAAGMDQVIDVIRNGGVGHRFPEPDSLVTLDPCDLVGDETVTAFPGFADLARVDNPGGHQCHWRSPTDETELRVEVAFEAGPMPEVWSEGVSNTNPVAGRPSVTNMNPRAAEATVCVVSTGHIPFTEFEEQLGLVEIAEVFVYVPGENQPVACQAATAVATELWPKLPPA